MDIGAYVYIFVYIYMVLVWGGCGMSCGLHVCVDVLACGLALFVGKCKLQWWDTLDRLELQ